MAVHHKFSQNAESSNHSAPERGADGDVLVVDGVDAGNYKLSHLRALEARSIHVMREVAAEFERPALMFSGGKDSIVMLHLALKAFCPGPPALPRVARRHRSQLLRGY
jgi:hypothetical protein